MQISTKNLHPDDALLRPAVDPNSVPHTHRCVDYPKCLGEWTHTPNESWAKGRWGSHECPKCRKVQFKPTEGDHDVFM